MASSVFWLTGTCVFITKYHYLVFLGGMEVVAQCCLLTLLLSIQLFALLCTRKCFTKSLHKEEEAEAKALIFCYDILQYCMICIFNCCIFDWSLSHH